MKFRFVEHVADTLAQVALDLDALLGRRAAGRTARALQLLAQFFQELGILWKPYTTGHCFPAAPPFLLHPQFRDDPRGIAAATSRRCAALAVSLRPSAHRTLTGKAVEYTTRALGLPLITSSSAGRPLLQRLRNTARVDVALSATIDNFDVDRIPA